MSLFMDNRIQQLALSGFLRLFFVHANRLFFVVCVSKVAHLIVHFPTRFQISALNAMEKSESLFRFGDGTSDLFEAPPASDFVENLSSLSAIRHTLSV